MEGTGDPDECEQHGMSCCDGGSAPGSAPRICSSRAAPPPRALPPPAPPARPPRKPPRRATASPAAPRAGVEGAVGAAGQPRDLLEARLCRGISPSWNMNALTPASASSPAGRELVDVLLHRVADEDQRADARASPRRAHGRARGALRDAAAHGNAAHHRRAPRPPETKRRAALALPAEIDELHVEAADLGRRLEHRRLQRCAMSQVG